MAVSIEVSWVHCGVHDVPLRFLVEDVPSGIVAILGEHTEVFLSFDSTAWRTWVTANKAREHSRRPYALSISSNQHQFEFNFQCHIADAAAFTHCLHFICADLIPLKNRLWCDDDSLMHFTYSVKFSTFITSSADENTRYYDSCVYFHCVSIAIFNISLKEKRAREREKRRPTEWKNKWICQCVCGAWMIVVLR